MRWGMKRIPKGNDIPEAEDHYKRALALDPKLAMAWARLGVIYLNSGQNGKAMEYFTKAHELSGDVSERERLYIEGHYYAEVTGDLDKAIETLQVAVQEYPLQIDNYVNLGAFYISEGKPEQSQEVLLKGWRCSRMKRRAVRCDCGLYGAGPIRRSAKVCGAGKPAGLERHGPAGVRDVAVWGDRRYGGHPKDSGGGSWTPGSVPC
jgi:hypothetical protein